MKRIQSVPLVIGQFLEAVDQDHAIVGSTTGNHCCAFLSRGTLFPGRLTIPVSLEERKTIYWQAKNNVNKHDRFLENFTLHLRYS